jgi:uncharacterized OB-fold protein
VAPAEAVSQGWWAATSEGRLTVQRCRTCGQSQLYPRVLCTACSGTDLELVDASGRATVHSMTVVHRAPHPAFTPPYVVALVRLDEGPTMMSNVVGCEPTDVHIGQALQVTWHELDDGRRLPLFTPAEEG